MEQALIRGSEAAAKKRHRTSTPVLEVANPEKRAKSDPGQNLEIGDSSHDPTPIRPRDLPTSCEPQLEMSPAVQLECFRPLEKEEEMSGVIEEQEGITRPDAAGPVPPDQPQGLTMKTKSQASKKSGALPQETAPMEARSSSKAK